MNLDEISTDLGQEISDSGAFGLRKSLLVFLMPLLTELDGLIDKRLVRTFFKTICAILEFRHSKLGLLLSELGGYILTPDKAPAGTKRLSNLLRCDKWSYHLINRFLWKVADNKVETIEESGCDALAIWDESVMEKSESQKLEGLCPVRSSKAARLLRIKPGYFHPPTRRPIFVPGLNWLGVLITGSSGAPTLAAMRWWTSRGPLASDRRTQEKKLLKACAKRWGRKVVHLFDRGFAGSPWLGQLLKTSSRFVSRWPKSYRLTDSLGQLREVWKITRGKRSVDSRSLYDARRRCERKVGIFYTQVTHGDYPSHPLFLVVARRKGQSPWYLVTNEAIGSVDEAWRIVFAYLRRWQIEMTWRYGKAELAMESPRLWKWENRLKLLLMASLAYAFLLSLLSHQPLVEWLMRYWCHRTGKKVKAAKVPLYRLRSAISRLWGAYPSPSFSYS